MKIFIQNIKQGISEFEEISDAEIIPEKIQQFYPDSFKIKVLVDKFERDLRVRVAFSTKADYVCDRCLTEFSEEVSGKHEQIYSIGSNKATDGEEIVHLAADIKELDISPLIGEAIYLNHPIKLLCKPDCKGICPGCGSDLNNESCRCSSEKTDPRWEQLRKLIR